MKVNYTINVKDFNVIGDNETDNTLSLQKAIESCSKQGGGTVYVPPGQYVTGTLRFENNVTLYLENGALLIASKNPEKFLSGNKLRHNRLLIGDNLENIGICGRGRIVGTGQDELQRRAGTVYDIKDRPSFRPGGVHFRQCTNVVIRDVIFEYSDNWTLCLDQCRNGLIDGITILNNYFRTNSDGIDIVSCDDIRISNCSILAGDDGIVLKTLEPIPCKNVAVTNCIIESCSTGLKLGTESYGGFSNILFSNCIVKNAYGGAGIFIKDGATVESVKFSQCLFSTYDDPHSVNLADSICPIFIDVEKRTKDSRLGAIRNVTFQDITVSSENSILVQSPESTAIHHLSFKGLLFDVQKDFDFSRRLKPAGTIHAYDVDAGTAYIRKEAYMVLCNVSGLYMDDVLVHVHDDVWNKKPRNAVWGKGLVDPLFKNVRCCPEDDRVPPIYMEDGTA